MIFYVVFIQHKSAFLSIICGSMGEKGKTYMSFLTLRFLNCSTVWSEIVYLFLFHLFFRTTVSCFLTLHYETPGIKKTIKNLLLVKNSMIFYYPRPAYKYIQYKTRNIFEPFIHRKLFSNVLINWQINLF